MGLVSCDKDQAGYKIMKEMFETMDVNEDRKVSFQESYDAVRYTDTASIDNRLYNGLFGGKRSLPINFETFWKKWVESAGYIYIRILYSIIYLFNLHIHIYT